MSKLLVKNVPVEKVKDDRIEGHLEVGTLDGEVVINLPQGMTGHIKFAPRQARGLAALLLKHAAAAEGKPVEDQVLFIKRGGENTKPIGERPAPPPAPPLPRRKD